jgi:hypothetical protein
MVALCLAVPLNWAAIEVLCLSNRSTLESIVWPIAFDGITTLTKGLEIAKVVAAAVVDWDDRVQVDSFRFAIEIPVSIVS